MKTPYVLLFAAVLAGFLALVLSGCGGQIDPAGASESTSIPNPRLRVVDGTGVDVQPDVLHLAGAVPAALRGVAAGDVLASSTGYGFLRRVVSVAPDGEGLSIVTEQAAIDDALIQGTLHSSNDLLLPGDRVADRTVDVPPLVINFDGVPLLQTGAGKATLNGSVTFHPYLDVDLQVAWGRVKDFNLVLHGDLSASADVEVTAGQQLSASFSQTIWSAPPVVLTQWIGPFPLVEVISLELTASGEAHAGVTSTMTLGGVEAQAKLAAGAHYDGSSWTPVGDRSFTINAISPSVSVTTSVGGSVKLQARASIRFYGVAGPYVGVGPYARVELSDTNGTVTRGARIGVSGDFGGDISIMGHRIAGYDVQLFDVGRDITF